MDDLMPVLIVFWMLCGVIAAAIGRSKGEGITAFIIGFVFGPFGIVAALLSKGNRRTCPHCREFVNQGASRCSHCGGEIYYLHRQTPEERTIQEYERWKKKSGSD